MEFEPAPVGSTHLSREYGHCSGAVSALGDGRAGRPHPQWALAEIEAFQVHRIGNGIVNGIGIEPETATAAATDTDTDTGTDAEVGIGIQ